MTPFNRSTRFLFLLLIGVLVSSCAKKTPPPKTYEVLPRIPAEIREREQPVPKVLQRKVDQPKVRIGLSKDEKTITLTGSQLFYVVDPVEDEKLGQLQPYQEIRLKIAPSGIQVYGPKGNLAFDRLDRVFFGSTKENAWFSVNGQRYRGFFEISRNGPDAMLVVNVIGVEDYLRGVVPREIGKITPDNVESAKAQAVAARTYTFANLGRRAALGFDLYGTVQDQVYGGMDAEQPLIDQAILATVGLVGTYQDQLIEAYYHSTCGGTTANVENTWNGGQRIPYLRTVNDTRGGQNSGKHFCAPSPHYRWTESWSRSQLENSLRKYLPKYSNLSSGSQLGQLRNIYIQQRDSSGRNIRMVVETSTGTYTVKGDKIRWVLRRPGTDNILRSSYFDIDRNRGGGLTVRGRGNGHGVGMCQWGAMEMARDGFTFEQIIMHYYPGTRLKRIY